MFNFTLLKDDEEILLDWKELPDLNQQINSRKFISKEYLTAETKNIKAVVSRDEMITIIKRTTNLNYRINYGFKFIK